MKRNILKNKQYRRDLERVLERLSLETLNHRAVLITGGLGLIGSSVVDLLLTYDQMQGAGIRIYVADINADGFSARYGAYPSVIFVPYDATKPISFDFQADYIIHGAGVASPELYVQKPVETVLSNFEGLRNLLDYTREVNAERLLYISSSEVYGVKDTAEPFEESRYGTVGIDSIRSSYAVAKRASEMLCKSYTAEYALSTVCVRPGHIFGPTASVRDKRISSDFAYKAAAGEKLVMKSAGTQKRSYCYSLDCASAILTALLRGNDGESYNIGCTKMTTIREMAEILAQAGGVAFEAASATAAEQRAFNPMDNSSLDDRKIRALGHTDAFDVKEALEHTVSILKEIYYS